MAAPLRGGTAADADRLQIHRRTDRPAGGPGHPERYLFGFEESYGYLSGSHVRDKDGVNAVMLACECAAWYAGQGMTLLDAMNALYETYGWYRENLLSRAFEGEDGMRAMSSLMASPPFLRPPLPLLEGRHRQRGLSPGRFRPASCRRAGIPPGGGVESPCPALRNRAETENLTSPSGAAARRSARPADLTAGSEELLDERAKILSVSPETAC